MDKLAKKNCQTMLEKEDQLKISQREVDKLSRELNNLKATREARENVHNSQIVAFKGPIGEIEYGSGRAKKAEQ